MSLFRGEKKNEDESSYYSDSSSSWHSSSDESSSFSEASERQRKGNNRLDEEDQYVSESAFRLSSLMRHRKTKVGGDCEEGRQNLQHDDRQFHENRSTHSGSDDSFSKMRKKRRRGRAKRNYVELPFHWSTGLLAMSLLVWCGVQLFTTDEIQRDLVYSQVNHKGPHRKNSKNLEINGDRRPHRPKPVERTDVASKEALKPGCELDPTWQTPDNNSKLLACQLLHEMDLSKLLSSPSSGKRQRSLSSDAYLGSGLWRDVWKIGDTAANNSTKFVVLKTMKPEHDVITRNLERHRREAAAMSHLTQSPHIADIFAYCGNSILTEFASEDLSRAVKPKETVANDRIERKEKDKARRPKDRNDPERKLHSNDSINVDLDKGGISEPLSSSLSTFLPLTTRIDWALQASKAIADLHRIDVIHADIQTKQFLVISLPNDKVRIKVNDFNRCRFVPRKSAGKTIPVEKNTANATSIDRCTVRIPSAPGSFRSPEEYADKELTVQMDVYSLGHVLYEIWTNGEKPWRYVGGKHLKDKIMRGALPIELQRLKERDEMTLEDANSMKEDDRLTEMERDFGRVISKCYLLNPKRRITADDLVRELTLLLDRVQEQNTMRN